MEQTALRKYTRLGKHFEFGPTYRGGCHGLELENKEALLLPGQRLLGPPPGQYGFPLFPETPRLRPDKKEYDRPPRDLEQFDNYWLVSQRLKDVLEAVDPQGVAFAECEVFYISGKPMELKHNLCDVIREIDALDEEESDIRIRFEPSGRKVYDPRGSKRFIFKEDIIGSAHIFRQKGMFKIVCDALLRDACRAAGIKDPHLFEDASVR
jgi:Immunity protein family (Imm11)